MAPKNARAKKSPNPQRVFGKNGVLYTFPHGNEEQIQIRVDFSQVPSPPNYYYADSLHLRVDKEQRMAVLSFGHRNPNTDTFLSNRIDVVMPFKSIMGPFWLSSRPVEAVLDKLLEVAGLTGETRPISSPDGEALILFANMIFLAVGDGESTLDFYHLAPREVHLAKTQKKDMELEPTVRVIMSSVLTKHFFNMLRPYAESAAEPLPALERSQRAARTR